MESIFKFFTLFSRVGEREREMFVQVDSFCYLSDVFEIHHLHDFLILCIKFVYVTIELIKSSLVFVLIPVMHFMWRSLHKQCSTCFGATTARLMIQQCIVYIR